MSPHVYVPLFTPKTKVTYSQKCLNITQKQIIFSRTQRRRKVCIFLTSARGRRCPNATEYKSSRSLFHTRNQKCVFGNANGQRDRELYTYKPDKCAISQQAPFSCPVTVVQERISARLTHRLLLPELDVSDWRGSAPLKSQ